MGAPLNASFVEWVNGTVVLPTFLKSRIAISRSPTQAKTACVGHPSCIVSRDSGKTIVWATRQSIAGVKSAAMLGFAVIKIPGAIRSFESFSAFKTAFGAAGKDRAWHHIVEQSKAGEFGVSRINSTDNIVNVSADINQKLANYYSSKQEFTNGQTVREWLSGQSWEQQYKFGMEKLKAAQKGKL